MQSGLKIIKNIQSKIKTIIEHFHRSTVAADKLRTTQIQINSEKPPLKLKMDVITRWNSTFVMFQRICLIQESVEASLGMLHNPVETLSADEWITVREICTILKPFQQITVETSAEKNVSVSKVIVLIRGSMLSLNKMRPTFKMGVSVQLVDEFIKLLSKHFHQMEHNTILSGATFLDPQFKQRGFHDPAAITRIKDLLTTDMKKMIDKMSEKLSEPLSLNLDDDVAEDDDIWKHLDFETVKVSSTSTALVELRQYTEEGNILKKENPLDWWKARENTYPRLSKLAKKYLSVVATSVPRERIYSKAGQMISERRSRLKSKNVEMILFLNANT